MAHWATWLSSFVDGRSDPIVGGRAVRGVRPVVLSRGMSIMRSMRRQSAVLLLPCAALMAGCASTGAVPAPFPRPGTATARPAPADEAALPITAPTGYAIAGTALALRGAPYRDGGADPSGFDCSGFVTYVFARHGFAIPRTVTDQYRAGQAVPLDQLQPGDLVFFATATRGASHVGIAIGGDEFVHAPSGRGEVRVERLGTTYWRDRFIGARRMS